MNNVRVEGYYQLDRFLDVMKIYGENYKLIGNHEHILKIIIEPEGFFPPASIVPPCNCGQFFMKDVECVSNCEFSKELRELNILIRRVPKPRFIVQHIDSDIFEICKPSKVKDHSKTRERYKNWLPENEIEILWEVNTWENTTQKFIKSLIKKFHLDEVFIIKLIKVIKSIYFLDESKRVENSHVAEAFQYFQVTSYFENKKPNEAKITEKSFSEDMN